MLALIKEGPYPGLSLKEVEIPEYSDDEVLIKIKTTAICGTDLHIYNWDTFAAQHIKPPLIIGHEFVGEIVALGKSVKHLKLHERVSGEGHITCGICRNCREDKQHLCVNTVGLGIKRRGAFADYLCLPSKNVIPIPDDVSDDVAAILDPLGNAVHSTSSFDLVGEDILITGAGPIGLMALSIAKKEGAKNIIITDINEYRLNLAKQLGAFLTVNVSNESISEALNSIQYSGELRVGFEMSGSNEAIQSQLDLIYPGGSIALLGIPQHLVNLDFTKIIFKGLTLQGIYGRKMFSTWNKTLALLKSGLDVTPIITHHFEAKDFKKAFELLHSNAGKILLHWN